MGIQTGSCPQELAIVETSAYGKEAYQRRRASSYILQLSNAMAFLILLPLEPISFAQPDSVTDRSPLFAPDLRLGGGKYWCGSKYSACESDEDCDGHGCKCLSPAKGETGKLCLPKDTHHFECKECDNESDCGGQYSWANDCKNFYVYDEPNPVKRKRCINSAAIGSWTGCTSYCRLDGKIDCDYLFDSVFR